MLARLRQAHVAVEVVRAHVRIEVVGREEAAGLGWDQSGAVSASAAAATAAAASTSTVAARVRGSNGVVASSTSTSNRTSFDPAELARRVFRIQVRSQHRLLAKDGQAAGELLALLETQRAQGCGEGAAFSSSSSLFSSSRSPLLAVLRSHVSQQSFV